MVQKESGEARKFHWLIFIIVSVLILIIAYISFLLVYEEPTCGDGTLYSKCSKNEPYFCKEGNLIQMALSCGCPNDFFVEGDSCTNGYFVNPKEIALNYSLNGEENQFTFNVYGGFYNYAKGLSRFIDSKENPNPTRRDFKLKMIEDELQREMLLPLVVEIQNIAHDKNEQVKIASSIVQNIPYLQDENSSIFDQALKSRYPYEVLYDEKGVCGEKSNLLAFLLKELGYGTSVFYFPNENHEAVGISCSLGDFKDTGYCAIDATTPFPDELESFSMPEVMVIS